MVAEFVSAVCYRLSLYSYHTKITCVYIVWFVLAIPNLAVAYVKDFELHPPNIVYKNLRFYLV